MGTSCKPKRNQYVIMDQYSRRMQAKLQVQSLGMTQTNRHRESINQSVNQSNDWPDVTGALFPSETNQTNQLRSQKHGSHLPFRRPYLEEFRWARRAAAKGRRLSVQCRQTRPREAGLRIDDGRHTRACDRSPFRSEKKKHTS